MQDKMRICICGGGNVSHAMAGHLAATGYRPDILTRKPERWGRHLTALRPGEEVQGELGCVCSDPGVVARARLIFISVPQFALEALVSSLVPHLHAGQAVILTPGVAEACRFLPLIRATGAEALVLQRVPFICRTECYGQRVHLLGGRPTNGLYAACDAAYATYAPIVERLFGARVVRIESQLSFLLSISNPILHPSRLLELFEHYKPGRVYDHQFLFYHEWGDRASELYLAADEELQAICRACGDVAAQRELISGRVYYESADAAALTAKIRSIAAFAPILTPMLQVPGGWVPDFGSRYFTEDIPYGTRPIVAFAEKLGVSTPTLRSFVDFGEKWIGYNATQMPD